MILIRLLPVSRVFDPGIILLPTSTIQYDHRLGQDSIHRHGQNNANINRINASMRNKTSVSGRSAESPALISEFYVYTPLVTPARRCSQHHARGVGIGVATQCPGPPSTQQ